MGVIEGGIANGDDAAGNGVASRFAARILNERRLQLVEQHAGQTAIKRVGWIHRDREQADAIIKRITADAGDAAADHGVGQAPGVEGVRPEGGDAVGDSNVCQLGVIEGVVTNAGEAARQRDTGQAAARGEGEIANGDDAAGNDVASRFAARILNERRLQLVEQHAGQTAIKRVGWIHRDREQAAATRKRKTADAGDAAADHGVGQARALSESVISDAGDAVGDRNVRQAGVIEGEIANGDDAARQRDTGQAAARGEGGIANGDDAARNGVASRFAARILNERRLALVEQHAGQTAIKRVGWIHRDREQAAAIRKHTTADAGDAAADHGVGQAIAGSERVRPEVGDAVGDSNVRQAGVIEGGGSDAGEAARQRDTGQAAFPREGRAADGRDRQAIDRAGDGLRPAGAGVPGDGDGAAIGLASELGSFDNGKRGRLAVRYSYHVADQATELSARIGQLAVGQRVEGLVRPGQGHPAPPPKVTQRRAAPNRHGKGGRSA